jgi:hypothetical protein
MVSHDGDSNNLSFLLYNQQNAAGRAEKQKRILQFRSCIVISLAATRTAEYLDYDIIIIQLRQARRIKIMISTNENVRALPDHRNFSILAYTSPNANIIWAQPIMNNFSNHIVAYTSPSANIICAQPIMNIRCVFGLNSAPSALKAGCPIPKAIPSQNRKKHRDSKLQLKMERIEKTKTPI